MAVALRAVETRRDVAERLIALHLKHAVLFAQVDALKDELRGFAESEGKGYTEKFPGKGSVQVSAGTEGGKFKGIVPVLDEAAFLALSEKRRKELIDGKVVAMVTKTTKASRPSVTVKT